MVCNACYDGENRVIMPELPEEELEFCKTMRYSDKIDKLEKRKENETMEFLEGNIPIEYVSVGNMNRLVKTAIKQYKQNGDTGLMYHSKTGKVAKRDSMLVSSFQYWHFLTSSMYPMYREGKYIGDSIDNLGRW